MKKQYIQMTDSLIALEKQGLSASIYTQPFDVETEQNGLLTYDREIAKLPIRTIRAINGKLWPATKNYLITTQGVTIRVADSVNKDYVDKLKEYAAGNHESQFIRSLALMARAQKDNDNAIKFGNEYITSIKNEPLTTPNKGFVAIFTTKISDPGFPLLLEYLKSINDASSDRDVSFVIQDIIYREQVRKILTDNPDWSAVDSVIKLYPQINGEFIVGNSVIRYLNAVVQKQPNATRNLVKFATIYDSRYDGAAYNDWAWALFGASDDKAELTKALEWSRKSIDHAQEREKPMVMDTYANLLYKLGRREEALEWEAKAVAGDPGNAELNNSFAKMKMNQPTW